MKKTQSALLLAMSLFGGTAYAAESFTPHPYFGIGYSYADMDYRDLSADNGLLGAIFGYRFHPNFALDFRGYGNVSDDNDYGEYVEIKHSYSVLAKGIIPANDYVYFYGMFGLAKSRVSLAYDSNSEHDVQYGVGMAISKGGEEPFETQIEWMKLYDKDGLDATGINLNIVFNVF